VPVLIYLISESPGIYINYSETLAAPINPPKKLMRYVCVWSREGGSTLKPSAESILDPNRKIGMGAYDGQEL